MSPADICGQGFSHPGYISSALPPRQDFVSPPPSLIDKFRFLFPFTPPFIRGRIYGAYPACPFVRFFRFKFFFPVFLSLSGVLASICPSLYFFHLPLSFFSRPRHSALPPPFFHPVWRTFARGRAGEGFGIFQVPLLVNPGFRVNPPFLTTFD